MRQVIALLARSSKIVNPWRLVINASRMYRKRIEAKVYSVHAMLEYFNTSIFCALNVRF